MTDQPPLPGMATSPDRDHDVPSDGSGHELLADGSSARFWPEAFPSVDADRILRELETKPRWRQEMVTIGGRVVRQPRLTAWQGDPGRNYRYSGLTLAPTPWSPAVLEVRAVVEELSGVVFN